VLLTPAAPILHLLPSSHRHGEGFGENPHGGGARDRSDWRVIHKGLGGFNRGEGHDARAELPHGHPWHSELGHGVDGIRWFSSTVGRRGTGVEEGFLPGGASEAEASRRAHDSACRLARCRPSRCTRTCTAWAAVWTREEERETGGMTGGPGLAVRENRR
jgi:hypothetical protein